jgi:hypothetical protein
MRLRREEVQIWDLSEFEDGVVATGKQNLFFKK